MWSWEFPGCRWPSDGSAPAPWRCLPSGISLGCAVLSPSHPGGCRGTVQIITPSVCTDLILATTVQNFDKFREVLVLRWPCAAGGMLKSKPHLSKINQLYIVKKRIKKTTTATCRSIFLSTRSWQSFRFLTDISITPHPQKNQGAYLECLFLFEELPIQPTADYSECVLKEVCVVSWKWVRFTANNRQGTVADTDSKYR